MLTKNKLYIKENIVSIDTFTRSDVKVIAKKCCYQGFFTIDEYQLQHKLYQGGYSKILTREIFERGDAVVLMPYDVKNDNLIFVTQFRAGALRLANENKEQSPWLIEFIAGMFNENENPIDVAIREAKEEANLIIDAANISPIMQYLSSPGGTTENIHLYLGLVNSLDEQGKPITGYYGLAEEGEDILVSVMSRVEAMQWLAQGKINNAATVIGLQWLQLNYQQLQAKQQ